MCGRYASWHGWLGTDEPPPSMLEPCDGGTIEAFAVGTQVSSPAHDAPDCIDPLDA